MKPTTKTFADLLEKHKAEIAPEAEKVRAAGGLYIIGTERHDSRRIDNQLRGRAGRQGDPGRSRFFLSMEDDLMRLFGGDKLGNMSMFPDDEPIESKMLTNVIENAQQKVESRNFAARKSTLEFDDVMNQQRNKIYSQRDQVLNGENLKESVQKMIKDTIHGQCALYLNDPKVHDNWNVKGLRDHFLGWLTKPDDFEFTPEQLAEATPDSIADTLYERACEIYESKEAEYGSDVMRELERVILLRCVDTHWMDHIDAMDELRNGIHLRAYAQHDPIVEFRNESYDMFNAMSEAICEDTAKLILTVRIRREEDVKREQVAKVTSESSGGDVKGRTVVKTKSQKVGRNDPCPCGSGKKYKKCCGRDEA